MFIGEAPGRKGADRTRVLFPRSVRGKLRPLSGVHWLSRERILLLALHSVTLEVNRSQPKTHAKD